MLEIVYAVNIIVGIVKDNRFTKTTVEHLRKCMLKEHYRCVVMWRTDFQMEFCSFLVS